MRSIITILCLIASSTTFAAKKHKDFCVSIPHSTAEFDNAKKFNGCRLTEVETGSTYERLGLKVGDLVQPRKLGLEPQNGIEKHSPFIDDKYRLNYRRLERRWPGNFSLRSNPADVGIIPL